MASDNEFQKLDRLYRTQKTILLIKHSETVENVYDITTYFDTKTKNIIKISVRNKSNEEESYSCVLLAASFATLRQEQDLLVTFEDFPRALNKILAQCTPNEIYIKINISEDLYLGFYTKLQLKELSVLKLPLEYTNPHEIIMYFKQKLLKSTNEREELLTKNNALEAELYQVQNCLATTIHNVRNLGRHNRTLSAKHMTLLEEYKDLENEMKRNEEEKILLMKKFHYCQMTSIHMQKKLNSTMSNLDSFKSGVTYYLKKTKTLQNTLETVQRNTVTIVKYKCLMTMFSTAVADLMKRQLYLKQVLTLNELQNSDNKNLKDELARCIEAISNMESNLQTAESHMIGFKQKGLIEALEKKLETENKP